VEFTALAWIIHAFSSPDSLSLSLFGEVGMFRWRQIKGFEQVDLVPISPKSG
jgi:hypothetical protein